MRPAALFALLVLAGLILFGVGTVKVEPSSTITPETSSAFNHPKNQVPDPAGTVKGAYDANKIPDHVALSLMFRLIQKLRVDHQDQRLQGYLNLIGFDGEDRQALLSAADEFNNEVGRLDEQARAIKDKTWPNPTKAVLSELTQLDNRKNAVVTGIVHRMLARMSAMGNSRFQQHVRHVKTRVKMFPPTALPTLHHNSQ